MTEAKQKQLDATRQERRRQEQARLDVVDGNNVIADAARSSPLLSGALQAEAEAVPVKAGKGKKKAEPRLKQRR